MSVCAVPPRRRKTNYATPGSYTITPPSQKYEFCLGSTTSVIGDSGKIITQVVCCPSPGPAGPQGPEGPQGPAVETAGWLKYHGTWTAGPSYFFEDGVPKQTSVVKYKDVMYVCISSHGGSPDTEPGLGPDWQTKWEVFGNIRRLRWTGDWAADYMYYKSDVVRNQMSGGLYVAKIDGTSSELNEPGFGDNWEDNWDLMTTAGSGSLDLGQLSFFDQLKNNVFDWMKNATVGDWLTALAIGTGIVWAGSKILEAVFNDGTGDGNADTTFTGSPGLVIGGGPNGAGDLNNDGIPDVDVDGDGDLDNDDIIAGGGTIGGTRISPTLPVVIASLMEFGGFPINMIDVSLLPATLVNFTVDGNVNIRTVLSQLALAYQFDIISSGSIVKFVPKYQSTVRTLTRNDMGHVTDSGVVGGVSYAAKRVQGIDLPRSVTLKYYSYTIDHNIFTQTSTLETFTEGQDSNIEVPFTLTDAQAKAITESVLVNAHIEQQQYTFVTDYYNIDLEPSDVINIPLDSGDTTQVRIIEVSETDDGLLQFTAARSDYNSYSYISSGQTATAPPPQTTNTIVSIGYSDTLFLEVPPLNEADGINPRIKLLIHGYNRPGWPGADVYRSVDGGGSYTKLTSTSVKATFGVVAAPTANPSSHLIWDTTSSITVQLGQGSLLSKTDLAVLNGENWCMVGTEVIGFVNATLVGPDTYTLTRLLRGRVGSELSCSTHVGNELFVLLDSNLIDVTLDVAELGKTFKYKTVTYGSDISKATAVDVQPYGLNLRPWAPAQFNAVRQPNNDWLISWVERPRTNNSLRDYVEISHDPDYAGYGYAILTDTTVKRTGTTTDSFYTYTAAQQVTDFGSIQGTLKVSVTQLSTLVGGGFPAARTFT